MLEENESVLLEEKPSVLTETKEELATDEETKKYTALDLIITNDQPVEDKDYHEKMSTNPSQFPESAVLGRQALTEDLQHQIQIGFEQGNTAFVKEGLIEQNKVNQIDIKPSEWVYGIINSTQVESTTVSELPDGSEAKKELENQLERKVKFVEANKYFQKKILELQEDVEAQGVTGTVVDFISSLPVIFETYLQYRPLSQTEFNELPDTSARKLHQYLFADNVPISEIKRRINLFTDEVKNNTSVIGRNLLREQDILQSTQNPEDSWGTEIAILEAALLSIPILGKSVSKASKIINEGQITTDVIKDKVFGSDSVKKILENFGDKDKQALTEKSLEAVDSETENAYSVINNNPEDDITFQVFSPSGEYKKLDLNNKVAETVNSLEYIPLSDAHKAADKIAKSLGEKRVQDIAVEYPEFLGVPDAVIILGKKDGKGYITSKGALNAATNSLKLNAHEFEIVSKGDEFYIKVKKPITSSKAFEKLNVNEINKFSHRLLQPLKNNFELGDFMSEAMLHELAKFNVINELSSSLAAIKKLPKKKLKPVLDALDYTHTMEKWFYDEGAFANYLKSLGYKYNPDYWKFYKKYKEISDTSWYLMNKATHERLKAKGFIGLDVADTDLINHIEGTVVNGKKIDARDIKDSPVYDINSGLLVDDLDELKDYEFFIIPDKDIASQYGGTYYFAAKPKVIKTTKLPAVQVGYKDGIRRIYKHQNSFVKQANIVEREGKTIMLRPKTHYIARTSKETAEYANTMEKAREIYNNFKLSGNETIAKVEFEKLGIGRTWEEIKDLFDRGKLLPDAPFRVVSKNEPLPEEKSLAFIPEPDIPEEVIDLMDTGSLYYSKRGDHLRDLNGKPLEIEDALTALSANMSYAVAEATIMRITKKNIERWIKTFHPKIDKAASINELFNVDLSKAKHLTKAERNAAEQSRNAIRRFMNMDNNLTRRWKEVQQDIELKIHNLIPHSKTADLLTGSMNFLSSNSISFVRAVNFHAALGFWRLGNLFVQLGQAISIVTMSGVDKIIPYLSRSTFLVYSSLSPHNNIHKFLQNKIGKVFDIDATELEFLRKEYNRSGFDLVDYSTAYYSHSDLPLSGYSSMRNLFSKVAESSLIPFNVSEKFNRSVAFVKAWDELGYGALKRDLTYSERIELTRLTDKYNLGMTSFRASAFQKGLVSIPAQFFTYMFRMWEATMPPLLGGSARWTAKEKATLIGASFLLFGKDGDPTGVLADNMIDTLVGEENKPEFLKVAETGVLDLLNYFLSDGKVASDIGASSGPSGQVRDLLERIAREEDSFIDMALGATDGIFVELAKGLVFSAQLATTGEFDNSFEVLKNTLKDNVTSLRDISRGLEALESGAIYSRYGDKLYNVTEIEALTTMVGLPLAARTKLNDLFNEGLRIQHESKSGESKQMKKYLRLYLDETDREKAEEYKNIFLFFLNKLDLPENVKRKLVKKATKKNDYMVRNILNYYKQHGKLPEQDIILEWKQNTEN